HGDNRHDSGAYPTSSGEHQQHQYQSGDSYPTSASTEYQGNQGNQGRGTSYPTSTGEQQYQKPSVGERVGEAIHGDNRHDSGAYPTSSGEHQQHQYQSGDSYPTSTKYNDQYADAPHAETRGVDPTMSKHNEYGADVHFAPHATP
ncbi:Glycerophosphodiesterase, partial [Globisporangium polare]